MAITSATITGHAASGVKINDIQVVGEQTAVVAALTDSTGGAASDTCNDTTASVKDDMASVIAKVNAILTCLKAHGLMASA